MVLLWEFQPQCAQLSAYSPTGRTGPAPTVWETVPRVQKVRTQCVSSCAVLYTCSAVLIYELVRETSTRPEVRGRWGAGGIGRERWGQSPGMVGVVLRENEQDEVQAWDSHMWGQRGKWQVKLPRELSSSELHRQVRSLGHLCESSSAVLSRSSPE
jgi:hypothetical protein